MQILTLRIILNSHAMIMAVKIVLAIPEINKTEVLKDSIEHLSDTSELYNTTADWFRTYNNALDNEDRSVTMRSSGMSKIAGTNRFTETFVFSLEHQMELIHHD